MKAMILAAGLGTRLRPLTDNCPKALVELSGRTLLEIALSRLRGFGINEIIINVHHFADMISGYLKARNNFGMRVEISREDVLLDTGGGLKEAAWFFLEDSNRPDSSQRDEPFILHNVDVISTIDLSRMVQFHKQNHALATLAVQDRKTSRYLLFDDHLQLRARQSGLDPKPEPVMSNRPGILEEGTALAVPKNIKKSGALAPELPLHALAFSGIHVLSPRLLPLISEQGIFSIIDTYLRLAAQNEKILAFLADQYYWRDLGRPSDLAQAALDLQ